MNQQLRNVASLMNGSQCRWGFCSGWAIDLFLDRQTRPHADIDVAAFQDDQRTLRSHLATKGWSLFRVIDGQSVPWQTDERILPPSHEVWCRNEDHDPPKFELLLNRKDAQNLLYRRDPSITLRLSRAIVTAACGLPILAPEIVLLYKSKHAARPENAADFHSAFDHLSPESRQWLSSAIQRTSSKSERASP